MRRVPSQKSCPESRHGQRLIQGCGEAKGRMSGKGLLPARINAQWDVEWAGARYTSERKDSSHYAEHDG